MTEDERKLRELAEAAADLRHGNDRDAWRLATTHFQLMAEPEAYLALLNAREADGRELARLRAENAELERCGRRLLDASAEPLEGDRLSAHEAELDGARQMMAMALVGRTRT